MEFEVKEAGTWKKEVIVKVPKDEIAAKHREILRELRNTAAVPGFRIGHTPDEILSIRFRDDIEKRLKGTIISESAEEVVEKGEFKAVTIPDINQEEITVSPDSDLEYSFTVEVRPEFKLPEYKGLSVEVPSAEVTDEELDKAVEAMRYRVAEYKPAKKPAGAGDIVVGDYKVEVEGETVKEEKETALRIPTEDEDLDTLIGVGDLPVEAAPFKGMKAGGENSAEFTYPDDYSDEALRGKKAVFTIKASEIKKHELPEVNEEFAKKVGAESIDALRDALKGRIAADKKDAADRAACEAIADKLIEATSFELPEELLKSEQERRQTRHILQLSRMGVPANTITEQTASIKEESAKTAERELRKTFIFSAIAEEEKLEVGEEEVEERIDALARYWKTTPVAARSRLTESGELAAIYEDILDEKVLDLIKESAKITEVAKAKKKVKKKAKKTVKKKAKKTVKKKAKKKAKKKVKKKAKKKAKKKDE